jgi:hypothetical protein
MSGCVDIMGFLSQPDGTEKFQALGQCTAGQTLGEEGVFESGNAIRKYTAVASDETYLLEITKTQFTLIEAKFSQVGLSMDWFTLINSMKKEWIHKRSLRMRKDQE